MDPSTAAVVAALLGAVLGGGTVLAWRISDRQLRQPVPDHDRAPVEAAVVPPGVATVLNVLRSSAFVVDEDDHVLHASAPAYALGLVRGDEIREDALLDAIRQVRRDGEIRELDLDVRRGAGPAHVQARVAPLSSRLVLVLAEDRTQVRRVEEIRRDFVANVSHELKTPVGALMLLAEAAEDAADDPDAVRRFAGRMRTEAGRLTRLVMQIIELSRLQDDELLDRPLPVDIGRVVERVLEANEIEAKAKAIDIRWDGRRDLQALGNEDQVVLALSNLVANAVAYSDEHSTVTVSAQPTDDMVEVSVTDEGVGIPGEELERIFERFYRVDPSRHRSTGGTGLGLSIVKHVAATHGGEVTVWSREGQGSTFALRLPRRTDPVGSRASDDPAGQTGPIIAEPDEASADTAQPAAVDRPSSPRAGVPPEKEQP